MGGCGVYVRDRIGLQPWVLEEVWKRVGVEGLVQGEVLHIGLGGFYLVASLILVYLCSAPQNTNSKSNVTSLIDQPPLDL